jgi:hypothetical protein
MTIQPADVRIPASTLRLHTKLPVWYFCTRAYRSRYVFVLFLFLFFFFFTALATHFSHTVQAQAFYPHSVRSPPYPRATVWRGRYALHSLTIPFTLDWTPSCAFLYDYVTTYEQSPTVSMLAK